MNNCVTSDGLTEPGDVWKQKKLAKQKGRAQKEVIND